MSPTIPPKPLGKFRAEASTNTVKCSVCDNTLCVEVPEYEGFFYVYITKEQAMAFFNLVPRMEHESTNPDCDCGLASCHNYNG